ncbi:cbb3-type cytochrome oxidase assembly protein CcoS [Pseudobacteriovorax antillogorgiicola]|uniref:Cytochrome oxidase maturation protein, cbb3-type n=1 Tax=Pseudobacteriovorax antillogorgiicola TaxID=1513793 RepID=A0A1Y6BEV5_9BACT|nr:cbb3-type cytochrome oxidase assembly protein CcoS [Pseudobacteriovorax antillogorgiicola]TCS56408.1 cbb3-type cytochrome oxidase maturation protein [Pseudobacteriovorax antillogorgiicola]SMF05943.1 cytochrome oxidase maturation protein, cbb3-type [Pseudobacteriovorax antillogorgiicola]
MEVLFILIAISFGLAFVGLGYFIWAVKTGQYEDLQTPAEEILFDDFKRED